MTTTARTPYWFWSDDIFAVTAERQFHLPGKHPQQRHAGGSGRHDLIDKMSSNVNTFSGDAFSPIPVSPHLGQATAPYIIYPNGIVATSPNAVIHDELVALGVGEQEDSFSFGTSTGSIMARDDDDFTFYGRPTGSQLATIRGMIKDFSPPNIFVAAFVPGDKKLVNIATIAAAGERLETVSGVSSLAKFLNKTFGPKKFAEDADFFKILCEDDHEYHLPGKHVQQRHAGSRGGSEDTIADSLLGRLATSVSSISARDYNPEDFTSESSVGGTPSIILPDGKIAAKAGADWHGSLLEGSGIARSIDDFVKATGAIRVRGRSDFQLEQRPTRAQLGAMRTILTGMDSAFIDVAGEHFFEIDTRRGLSGLATLLGQIFGPKKFAEDADFFEVLCADEREYHLPGQHPQKRHGRKGPRNIESLSLTPLDQPGWKGEPQDLDTSMSKLETGELGEQIAVSWLRQQGFEDADSLNTNGNNFPVDLAHNHEVVEVKAGLASNSERAQQWRSTIGEPGIKEKVWLTTIDDATKLAWGDQKRAAILARKQDILDNFSSESGKSVTGKTATVIINPDTNTADLFMFDGFHGRIGWKSSQADEGYVGTFKYG